MGRAIQKHLRDFIAIIVLVFLALFIGGYILSHQRFYLPGWVPVLGSDFYELKGEFQTAQSVMPGQGQTVDIAGVPVGDVKSVDLKDGRAVVTMTVQKKYSDDIYKDASMLLRPKTGLNDMIVELTPGTQAAGNAPDGYTVPIRNTLPNVNLEEFFAVFDRDTRDYLKLLLAGGGQGLKGAGPELSAVLRRFDPTNRDIKLITQEVAKRRTNLARLVHSFQELATELGKHDKELAEWVDSTSAVFGSFAAQQQNLKDTIRLLPDALDSTNKALISADEVAKNLGPATRDLLPGAKKFASSSRASQKFFRQVVKPLKNQIRPFTRDVQPTVKALRPANENLAAITPDLRKTFDVLNTFLNEWAYNPPGDAEGYLFYTLWGTHIAASVYSNQDAHAPVQRGLIMTTCRSLQVLQNVTKIDPQLATIIELTNLPTKC
jgi:phospholipid/cholesterol/gamma-HCH transport system substrate-binding protein